MKFRLAALSILPLLLVGSAAAEAAAKPNVLVLVADDLRPDMLHALGNRQIATPNLDRLIAEGMTFTRATCAHPLCVPSRAEIISGRTGFRNGIYSGGTPMAKDVVPWAAAMKQAGYRTFYVGKWHTAGRPSQYGYDEAPGWYGSGKGPNTIDRDHAGRPVTGYTGWQFRGSDGRPIKDGPVGLIPGIDARFADAAIGAVEQPGEGPFFAHVNFTAPHDPRLIPPGYDGRYDPAATDLPPNFRPEHPFDHGNLKGRDEILYAFPRVPEEVRGERAAYDAVVAFLDEQVGRILAALDRTGQRDRTLVIFTADHGLALGSHGLMGKQNMYEHTIDVPLILRGPGIPAGVRNPAQCYLRDLYPTVCELVGAKIPPSVESHSLVPVIRGEKPEIYPFIVGYFQDSQRMIRTDRWKYIRYPKADREQLFDLAHDPLEQHDLSGDAQHADIMSELRTKLAAWLREQGDSLAGK
jgi:arylsulfatase A-like enzyme